MSQVCILCRLCCASGLFMPFARKLLFVVVLNASNFASGGAHCWQMTHVRSLPNLLAWGQTCHCHHRPLLCAAAQPAGHPGSAAGGAVPSARRGNGGARPQTQALNPNLPQLKKVCPMLSLWSCIAHGADWPGGRNARPVLFNAHPAQISHGLWGVAPHLMNHCPSMCAA